MNESHISHRISSLPARLDEKMEKLKQFGKYSVRFFHPPKSTKETGDFNFVTNFKEEKFSIIWRIENVHRCQLKCLESPTFSTRSCNETNWTLRLYPKGIGDSPKKTLNKNCSSHTGRSKDCVMAGLFIHRISDNPVTSSIRCCLSYKRDLLNNSIYSYPEKGAIDLKMDETQTSEYGTNNIFCAESLETPQTLIVRCDIYVTKAYNIEASGDCGRGISKSETLFQDLKALYENKIFSDITLKTKNEELPAHKAILASRSEVFAAMFRHDMKEAQTNVAHLVDEPDVLTDLLQYIYTGSIADFDVEKAIFVYPAANKYLLEELKEWCVDILLANLKVENVCQIAVLTESHPHRKLKEAVLSMFRSYTSEIFKRKEWKELVRDSKHHVLVSDILQAVSADFIANCCDEK